MPIAAAIAGAAVIGGGASIISSNKASKASKKAAAANNAIQTNTYNQNAAALAPYENQGAKATTAVNALLGLDGTPGAYDTAFANYQNSDGYKFRVDQGQRAVQSALGAKGYQDSGAQQKALLTYGQGVASDEFGKYINTLTGQQSLGLTAASAQAGVGQNYANAVSANNNAASTTASNAALSNAGTINGVLGNALSAYTYSKGLGSSYGGTLGGIY